MCLTRARHPRYELVVIELFPDGIQARPSLGCGHGDRWVIFLVGRVLGLRGRLARAGEAHGPGGESHAAEALLGSLCVCDHCDSFHYVFKTQLSSYALGTRGKGVV